MKLNELALFGGDPVRKTPFFPWPRVVERTINRYAN